MLHRTKTSTLPVCGADDFQRFANVRRIPGEADIADRLSRLQAIQDDADPEREPGPGILILGLDARCEPCKTVERGYIGGRERPIERTVR